VVVGSWVVESCLRPESWVKAAAWKRRRSKSWVTREGSRTRVLASAVVGAGVSGVEGTAVMLIRACFSERSLMARVESWIWTAWTSVPGAILI
jgi:NADH dehydrogenase FAD-containing subunit